MTEPLWEYTVHWEWGTKGYGAPLRESFTILARNDGEAQTRIKQNLTRIARRYSFDCGRLNHPLYPAVGGVYKKPFSSPEFVDMDLGTFFEREVKWTKQLIEQDKLYVGSDYNKEPCPTEMLEVKDESPIG